jgi:hypothetical protein
MRRAIFATAFAVLLVGAFVPANATYDPRGRQISHGSEVGPDDGAAKNHLDDHHQHGPSSGHLPASSDNVELVGKAKLTSKAGDISDVSALQSSSDGKWYAYLGDWGAHCPTGGVHVVDISDPANPTKIKYLDSGGFGYVTEGVQALHVDTDAFTGDLLVISNEWCAFSGSARNMPGGITIYDVTDPTNPTRLVRAFGDFDVHGNRANEAHSAIAWDAGNGNAYVAAIDNEELTDVDLFDITDPANPELLAETRLPGVNVDGYGQDKGSHDYDVLQFPDGDWHLMVSDWDAGWIDVNVTDPTNPVVEGDFDYAECDQVVPTACPPEGNAHQGEWNSDGSVFVGTDEDFSPFRTPITVLDGDLAGQTVDAGEFGFTKQVASFPGGIVNGPTIFGGYGCPGETVPHSSTLTAAEGEEKMIVFQRGPVNDPNNTQQACFFSEKIASGEQAGYDVVLVANHHAGAQGGETPGAFICGGQGSPVAGTAAGLCVGHEFMHEAFGTEPNYDLPYPDASDPAYTEPAVGTVGPRIEAQSEFDGWGYTRVIDTSNNSEPTEVAQITIPEGSDPAFASGFGDLTVHEVEVPRGDPNEGGPNVDDDALAYFSWYSGGMRVVDITDPANPTEVGHFIDQGGNDFWGVALAEDADGNRLFLGSDRDSGLYIFRYTGDLP